MPLVGSKSVRQYVIKKVPEFHGFCPPNTLLLRISEISFLINVDHVEAKRMPFEF